MPPPHRKLRLIPAACTLLAAGLAHAQVERYELGLRLREFERSLAASSSPTLRALALRELEAAVQAFFRLDQRGVAQAIDEAEAALSDVPPSPRQRFARSLQVSLEARLVAPAGTVACNLSQAYATEDGLPKDLTLEVRVGDSSKPTLQQPVASLPFRCDLPLPELPTGDVGIEWRILAGDLVLVNRRQGLSIVADLAQRLDRVEQAADECELVAARNRTLEQATLVAIAGMLQGMTKRRPEETVLPGARLLADAEALVAHLAAGEPYYTPQRTGQHWLRVPLPGATAAARLAAPAVPAGERRPIVVALHGAGGSENLFFDGYGDGLIARLAEARGWFVVAPRSGALAAVDLRQLVDALATRWPIDPQQVLVVGHSMGAAQAIAATTRRPEQFRAVAALGGGGAVPRKADLGPLPSFVGVGERDFARAQALQLHRQLQAAGSQSTLREYPAVEHLAIVQFALPDVFAFFDKALRRE